MATLPIRSVLPPKQARVVVDARYRARRSRPVLDQITAERSEEGAQRRFTVAVAHWVEANPQKVSFGTDQASGFFLDALDFARLARGRLARSLVWRVRRGHHLLELFNLRSQRCILGLEALRARPLATQRSDQREKKLNPFLELLRRFASPCGSRTI